MCTKSSRGTKDALFYFFVLLELFVHIVLPNSKHLNQHKKSRKNTLRYPLLNRIIPRFSYLTLFRIVLNKIAGKAPIQRVFKRGFPLVLVLCLILLVASACTQENFTPDFGDPYEIIVNDIPGAPDKPPRLLGDWLLIMVAYSGGCQDHDFNVETVVRRDTAHIWIKHANGGDSCEAYIKDDLNLELPIGVLSTRVIAMHDPAGDPPHLLKYD